VQIKKNIQQKQQQLLGEAKRELLNISCCGTLRSAARKQAPLRYPLDPRARARSGVSVKLTTSPDGQLASDLKTQKRGQGLLRKLKDIKS